MNERAYKKHNVKEETNKQMRHFERRNGKGIATL
jgi:hypothetical protein